ncbi:MAG: hypothetical protein CBR30_09265 [Dictyoglomus sp. NZ13-RE01]|nr:MAG: hypothetical protein CBR30_09265 [Dictyoglomus sp. NZ13-RE01]
MDKRIKKPPQQILALIFVIVMGILWLIFWRRSGIELYITIISIIISLIILFLIIKNLNEI